MKKRCPYDFIVLYVLYEGLQTFILLHSSGLHKDESIPLHFVPFNIDISASPPS